MFQHFRKYRHFFAIGLMGFYLAGGLQFPMLECLHFLSHLDDLAAGKHKSHHFHSHDATHSHNSLLMLNEVLDTEDNNEAPVNETSDLLANKFHQIFNSQQFHPFDLLGSALVVFSCINNFSDRNIAVPSPPPRA